MVNGKIKEVISLMPRNWKTLLIAAIFDVLFILALLTLRFIQTSIDNILFPFFDGPASWVYPIFYVLLEIFFVILVYSFFKYFIVKFMQEGVRKAEFEVKSFFSFLKLNCIIFVPLIVAVAFLLDTVLMLLNNEISKGGIDPFKFVFEVLAICILALIAFIFVYTFINILHFSFLKEKRLKRLLKHGIRGSFMAESYRIYWSNFKIASLVGILLLVIHFFVKSFVFNDFSSYVKNFGIYRAFIYWAIILTLYFLLVFNRLNFCMNLPDINKEPTEKKALK